MPCTRIAGLRSPVLNRIFQQPERPFGALFEGRRLPLDGFTSDVFQRNASNH